MTTPKPRPAPTPAHSAQIPEPFTAALAAVPLQETFTLDHALQLRDALSARVEHHGSIGSADAIAIAEGLINEQLISPTALRRVARAATHPEQCAESLCGYRYEHDHGTDCNHTCPCGKGS